MENLLEVNDLKVSFFTPTGEVKAVNGISYSVKANEVIGIVGESGSGKSVSAYTLMGVLPASCKIVGGSVFFRDHNILSISPKQYRRIRGKEISFIPQNPMTCLNPVLSIGNQMAETIRCHTKLPNSEAYYRINEIMRLVGISNVERQLKKYPHEFSGGMQQRIMIAMALLCNPKLVIADEPTTALDATLQAQILDLMQNIQEITKMSLIFITHNLGVVKKFCNRVMVMYAGKIFEQGTTEEIFYEPMHPYTIGLLRATLGLESIRPKRLYSIEGSSVSMVNPPDACAFGLRCKHCMKICLSKTPPSIAISRTHFVSCWLLMKKGRDAAI